jgi:hypothetical protein
MAETPDPPSSLPPTPRAPQPDTVELRDGSTPPGADETPASPAALSDSVPLNRLVGNYELLGEIERGGMGIVYRARERSSGLLVALKMMLGDIATTSGDRRRFVLEARATGELNHPGIVTIHSWGEHEGHPYYTMDFVPGMTLSRLLQQGPLPYTKAVHYLLGIARAVAAAHDLGIVHRDLKPGNIIIDLSDQPRVLDFGLAKRHRGKPLPADADNIPEALPVVPDPSRSPVRANTPFPFTETGAILGTPSYMAPEQVRAEHEQVGPEADVHALGAIFYEMVTGEPPFKAESTYDTLMQVLDKPPVPLNERRRGAPAALDDFCQRCLEKDPADRYPNAGSLADDLERRWRRFRLGARYARLTVRATVAFLLLSALSWLVGILFHLGPETLSALAGSGGQPGGPLQFTAAALAFLLDTTLFVLAPYLAEVGILVWLGAWVWHADRPWRICAAALAIAAAVVALSFLPELPFLRSAPLFFAWMLAADALAATGVALVRRFTDAEAEAEARTPSAEPYLQRLFAARTDTGPEGQKRRPGDSGQRKGLGPPPAGAPPAGGAEEASHAVALADLDLGKTVHRWDGHEVRWARQLSLDRPVLVWFDRGPAAKTSVRPGVVVRHPDVLALHALGSGPEGRFLVTEPVAASPLPELLHARGLVPQEAAELTARLATVIQAFHDQGAYHGRLSADWVLVRGDLEPVLGPCGLPGASAAERQCDVAALGRLLASWLPARSRWWQGGVLGPLYQVADAAQAGGYERAADLAAELERAAGAVRVRWRERGVAVVLGLLLVVPLLLPALVWGLDLLAQNDKSLFEGRFLGLWALADLLVGVLSATALVGYMHGRALVHRWKWRRRDVLLGPLLGSGSRFRLLLLGLCVLLGVLLLGATVAEGLRRGDLAWSLTLLAVEAVGVWLLGLCAAGLMTFLELLFTSLKKPRET